MTLSSLLPYVFFRKKGDMSGQQQQVALNKRLSLIYSALDKHQFSKVVNKLTSTDDEHILLLYALRAHALEKSGKTHLAVDCILRILCQLFPDHEWLEWIEQQWHSQLISSEEEGDKTKDHKDVSLLLLPSTERQQHLWKNYKEMREQSLLQKSSTFSKSNKSKKKNAKEKEVTILATQQLDEVRTYGTKYIFLKLYFAYEILSNKKIFSLGSDPSSFRNIHN